MITSKVTAIRGAKYIFLTRAEVIHRYGWARNTGYRNLRERRYRLPPAIGDRYRLDTLQAWEEERLATEGWPTGGASTNTVAADLAAVAAVVELPAKR